MTGQGIAFERLHDAGSPELERLLELYRAAIPAAERKPEAAIAAMCVEAHQSVLVAKQGDAVLGFAIFFAGESLALLEYLAVDRAARGQGIGAALYRHGRDSLRPLPLVIEVESDSDSDEGQALRARRKAFYRRLGCRELEDIRYILPLGDDPPPIDLLVDSPAAYVRGTTAAAWLDEIYTRVYGCAADDARLAVMLAALPERLELA